MGLLGPNNGGTFADDATVGTIVFSNPSNAVASDNSYATAALVLSQISHYLKTTNFKFFIPLDATVTGVLVEVERSATVASSLTDNSVKLVKGDTISGTEKATAATWPNTDAYTSYGGSTDLWGLTLAPADINLSTFGVAVSAIASLVTATAQIDHVRISVSYDGSNRPQAASQYFKAGSGISVAGFV